MEDKPIPETYQKYVFNRLELAGSLGDLGTLLPLAIGMIVVNGLDPTGLFFVVGMFYILSGAYYGVTVPVQPMKVIGAYSIAMGLKAGVITSSALIMGIFMLALGVTGAVRLIGEYTPVSVVRGIQLSVGVLLIVQGIRFMLGTSRYQTYLSEPHLVIQSIGPVPISVVLGVIFAAIAFLLIENRKVPAALAVVVGGILVGIFLGTHEGLKDIRILHLPRLLPFGIPGVDTLFTALLTLVLPQIPTTVGNAVIANADLTKKYFGENAKRCSYRALANSIGLANLAAFIFGGMPLCHGAGGLAAHYRFGARTAGSNIMIGVVFLTLSILFGESVLAILNLLPLSILGVLLVFAGSELALMIKDIKERMDLFVAIVMLGITIATNLAVAFIVGITIAYAFKTGKPEAQK